LAIFLLAGDTLEELYASLNEAMEGYIEAKPENNLPIPIPEAANNYSGNFGTRLLTVLTTCVIFIIEQKTH